VYNRKILSLFLEYVSYKLVSITLWGRKCDDKFIQWKKAMLWLLIIFALIFAFINGFRDSSSIMAGVISSNALPPRLALIICGIAEFIAPFLFGVAVAKAITTGLVNPQVISLSTITVAITAALIWTLFAWWIGIPSSSTHSLVGGILGAVLLIDGPEAIIVGGIYKVVVPLFLAPIIGLGMGYAMMNFIFLATRNATPRVNILFKRLQIVTMIGLALSHSANDAQKSMGIITLGLLLSGRVNSFEIPFVVILLCALAIGFGASRGDWRLMRTLGRRIYVIRSVNALASQVASSMVIFTSAILGAPVSTSQIISMALVGAGSAERVNKVRWQVSGDMVVTWLLTIPITMLIAVGLDEIIIALHL
jgi:PiT family inorganic phosphate transporter